MLVYDNLSDIPRDVNTVITLGTFDGVHIGHKKILDRVKNEAAKTGGRSFLITFDPHPKNVVGDRDGIKILTTTREKKEILEKYGLDNVFIIKFTKEFSQLTSEEFFKKYIIDGIGIKEIVIGYDHHFGRGRGGDEHTLREMGKEYGFEVSALDEVKSEESGITVSSTKIRRALSRGDIKLVTSLLSRYYSFGGTVVEGDKRGRLLGFPTANIKLEDETKLLPEMGIYAVEFFVDGKKHFGVMSIGKRPTFYDSGKITTEVFVFDFNKDIYGKFVTVNVVERIRGEEKFSSAEGLIAQMKKDTEAGHEILGKLVN